MDERARLLDRLDSTDKHVERVLRRSHRDPDVLELAFAVRDLKEAVALLLLVTTPGWTEQPPRPSDGPNSPCAVEPTLASQP